VGGVVFRAPGDDRSSSARSARSSERSITNITEVDRYRAVIFATVEYLSYLRSLIAATAEHQVYRTSRSSSIKHQLIELIRQRVHYQAAVSATAECSLYACFIRAHCSTSFGIEAVAIRRNTRQKTRQRGKVTITERSSVQQLNACFTYGRSLLQQLNTNVRARLDDKSLYGLCSKARVASLYRYHDDVTPCIAIWPSMHESNATLNPRFLKNYDSLGLP